MEVVREAYPDHTAQDPESKYHDPAATPDNPRWFMVDVRLARKLPRLVSLAELRDDPALVELPLVRRGARLSVMPVPEPAWRHIISMAGGTVIEASQRVVRSGRSPYR